MNVKSCGHILEIPPPLCVTTLSKCQKLLLLQTPTQETSNNIKIKLVIALDLDI